MTRPAQAGGLSFVPVDAAGATVWSRPGRLSYLDQVAFLPVADTELLNLSHYCPIAIDLGRATPVVVCLLGEAFVRKSCVSGEGRWLAPYMPLALRSLPFRSRLVQGNRIVEITPDLAVPSDAAAFTLYEADGTAGTEFQAVLGMLGVIERGAARLADAARLLLAADLLIPIGHDAEARKSGLMVVSGERLGRLTSERVAALAADRCLAFDLAAASLLSRRWLAEGLVQDSPAEAMAPAPVQNSVLLDQGLRDAIDQPLLLDSSPLFSFDDLFGPGAGGSAAEQPRPGP